MVVTEKTKVAILTLVLSKKVSVSVISKSLIVLIRQATRKRTGRDVTRASDRNIILILLQQKYFCLYIAVVQATIIPTAKKELLPYLVLANLLPGMFIDDTV